MLESKNEIDWSLTTWKGSRRDQHQTYLALPFPTKLPLLEELCNRGQESLARRKKAGLPCIDPYTGEVVPGSRD
jgi:hypothetical protein